MTEQKSVLVLAPSAKSKTTDLILKELAKNFKTFYAPLRDVVVIINKDKTKITYEKQDLTKFDYVLSRIDSKRVAYGYQIIKAFDSTEMLKPYSAEAVLIAHDKFLTTQLLSRYRVPIPKTYLAKTKESLNDILKIIEFPVMIKLKAGYGGMGIMYVEEKEAMKSIIESMETLKQEVLIQEFVENPGEDIRAFVIGDEVVACMKRVAMKDEKRANVKIGGKPVAFEASQEIKDVAIKAARALGADICAVDIIEGKEGPVVLELNINPGIQGLMEATNMDIPKKISDYIKSQMR
ncbi:RimK family alpha-L-glutamate ligase [Nanoarchaeota archaeon]